MVRIFKPSGPRLRWRDRGCGNEKLRRVCVDTPSDMLAQRMVFGSGLVGIWCLVSGVWYLVKSRASELDVFGASVSKFDT